MTFELYSWRFHFVAHASVRFPPGKASNTLRGAFGEISQSFAAPPTTVQRPSGLADPPWPFVFRASHLDGRRFEPGDEFSFAVHSFDMRRDWLPVFTGAFARLADEGIGPGRGRAELVHSPPPDTPPLCLTLLPGTEPVSDIRVEFLTPTRLRPPGEPHFGVLFSRLRDRICTLNSLYGRHPIEVDHQRLGNRAATIRTQALQLIHTSIERHSSRTGQRHPIGGFTGTADYEGDLAEFLPWLEAGAWTGVGRQTVWGNGEIRVTRR